MENRLNPINLSLFFVRTNTENTKLRPITKNMLKKGDSAVKALSASFLPFNELGRFPFCNLAQ
jgi:hypothetical protein